MFNATHGLFADTWSAWTELILGILLTLIGGYLWGIAGILLSKIIVTSLIGLLWKPYYLFHSVFHLYYADYWKGVARNYSVSLMSFVTAHYCINIVNINAHTSYLQWILYCVCGIIIFLIINLIATYALCKGAKDFLSRVLAIVRQKMNHG